jgi:RNA polymerase sigma-70 factor, ECF subfamily
MVNSGDRTNEFVQLFTVNARWVFAYIFMLVPNKDDAEEIYQETNTTLWQKFDEFVPGSNFRNWATQVAHYKILQYRDKRRRSPVLLDDALLEKARGTVARMGDRFDDLQWALEKCRDRLTPADRELLRKRYEPDATTQSVAEQMGHSVWMVYRALERIHQGLYDCIRRKLAAEESP